MHKIALIPSYEPDNRLESLVKELIKNKFEVIVINDGSNDKYNKIFTNIKKIVTVLEYTPNKGKGYALKYGLNYIKNHYDKYVIVTMDCDGQHTVKDAIKLCDYTIQHPSEFVIGKRMIRKQTPIRSKIGNSITRWIYRIATGSNVYDTQTGLRCFSNQLMDFNLNVEGERYEYEMNVLLFATRENIKITEIEIETIYINNNEGSHFNTLKDSYKIYKQIIKFSLSSIISFIIDYILYTILALLTNNVTLSNIIARIISATVNYTLNKNIVFKSNRKATSTLLEYILLAIIILTLNTLLLNLIIKIGINLLIAKIIVELVLFTISWCIQKRKIFKNN